MNTKSLEKFEVLNSEMLASVEGALDGAISLVLFLGAFRWWWTNSRSTKWGATRNFRACSCSPSGNGGTPNSCNFC